MEMRIPTGGSSLFETLAATDHASLTTGADDAIADVTPAQLDEALAALRQGHLEYVGLADGPVFIQVAGEGEGPYLIEHNPGQLEDQVNVPGGVTAEAVRFALHAFLARDPNWAQPFPWQNAGLGAARPSPSGGGRFRKRFGRS